MGFWKNFFGRKPASASAATGEDQAVLLHIMLEGQWPNDAELGRFAALQRELEEAISAGRVGELDGDEWGGGMCTIYMYGPDAEGLWDAIAPVIEKHSFPKGSHAIKRFGGPHCGRSERISIEWEG